MTGILPTAAMADVFPVVIGVLALLVGLGVVAMGVAALVDRRVARGALAALAGLGLTLAGAWMVGLFA